MKQSRAFIPTMREIPTDVEMKSHQLLLRAGFLRQHASGVYSYLPFGLKVLKKIEAIVQREMEALGAIEMKSASLQKESLARLFNLTENKVHQLFQVSDNKNRQYTIGSLHKEQIITLLKEEIHSYKQLPLMLYQIMTSFQNLTRPRFGLMESRELVQKEAYSFHYSAEDLRAEYEEMKRTYRMIFSKLHLKYYELSDDIRFDKDEYRQQFIAPLEEGDEIIAYSSTGGFSESIVQAQATNIQEPSTRVLKDVERVMVESQNQDEITDLLKASPKQFLKTTIYRVEEDFVAIVMRSDHTLNEEKLKRVLQSNDVSLAEEEAVKTLFSCDIKSVGPVQLPVEVRVLADEAVKFVVNGVSGANENGVYLKNINPERDFAVNKYADLRYIEEGELAPDGVGTVRFTNGIELGQLSSFGTSYSRLAEANYVDELGEQHPLNIGYYEINLSRMLAIVAEQHHDESGLKWPKSLAPCDIHLIPIDLHDEHQYDLAMNLYHLLQSYHFEVLLDDRMERAGVKFQDADLIGLPIRITIGKKAHEGILEAKFRDTGEVVEWQIGEVTEKLQTYFTTIG